MPNKSYFLKQKVIHDVKEFKEEERFLPYESVQLSTSCNSQKRL
jgi:hypothetical protein